MPTPTYVAIAKTVLTGTQATVTFSGISNAYTDLVLHISARDNYAAEFSGLYLKLNNDTASNYSYIYLRGQSTTASSTSGSQGAPGYIDGNTATSNTFGSAELYFPNYTASTNKPISGTTVSETNSATAGTAWIACSANLWRNTAAISQIDLTAWGSFVSGSRFDLYGIKNS